MATENTTSAQVVDLVTQQRIAAQQETIDFYHDLLVVKPSKELNQLPENIFESVFLPFFCGERKVSEQPDILVTWIGIAGTPGKEVEIIDARGKVLFNVPAMADTGVVDSMNKNGGQRMFDLIGTYMLHTSALPALGARYLNSVLGERMNKLMTESPTFKDSEAKWIEIFTRYDKIKKDPKEILVEENKGKLGSDEMFFE